jgi:hypothetical protein
MHMTPHVSCERVGGERSWQLGGERAQSQRCLWQEDSKRAQAALSEIGSTDGER